MGDQPALGCFDCGAAYGGVGWCDVLIPNEDWCAISPTGNEGGILCFGCIARRLERAGRSNVPMLVTSGPFERDPRAGDGQWLNDVSASGGPTSKDQGRVPYDDLAPQDQVDLIAWELDLDFDAALAVWVQRHGPFEEPAAVTTRCDHDLIPGTLHICPYPLEVDR